MLQRIVDAKRAEIERRCRERPASSLDPRQATPARGFRRALARPELSAIAEIKRRSPSKGPLREDLEPAELAREYTGAGACALSVLTDGPFFGGSDDDLVTARAATAVPVLRKDFTLDPYQILEARCLGADAVLLIVRLLDPAHLAELLDTAGENGLDALVEVHAQRELETALAAGAGLIGINSRDLDTFETDLDRALALRRSIPDGVVCVAESGIRDAGDVARIRDAGFDGFLVGEALVRASAPGRMLEHLLCGGVS